MGPKVGMVTSLTRVRIIEKRGLEMRNVVKRSAVAIVVLRAGIFIIKAEREAVADDKALTLSAEELDERIRDYIEQHPQVIMQAIQKWQFEQRQTRIKQAEAMLAQRREEVFHDLNAPAGGNPEGDVTVVEFMDYNCGYCRKTSSTVAKLLEEDGRIRIVYKELPVLGKGSQYAAQAALASKNQGKYLAFHQAMMGSQQRLEEPTVLTIAEHVGLDIEQLKKDMKDPTIQQMLQQNLQLAQALAINDPPAFIIGNDIVRGATRLDDLQQLIGKARQSLH